VGVSTVLTETEERTMPTFIFAYHQPTGYVPGRDPGVIAAWEGFFESLGDHVVDPGQPVSGRAALGEVGASTQLAGYSIVNAASLEAATALANGCPALQSHGGVQVGELAELPPDHVAERLRERGSRV
jgi:hypothetical protein